mgnify:CR=1 FL=1
MQAAPSRAPWSFTGVVVALLLRARHHGFHDAIEVEAARLLPRRELLEALQPLGDVGAGRRERPHVLDEEALRYRKRRGLLDSEERMALLIALLKDTRGWTIVGSSFGGLMGALFTCQRPEQVVKLVLLAPALIWPDFALSPPPVDVPVVVYQGSRDEQIPPQEVERLARITFRNLTFHLVDDDHGLFKTAHSLNWKELLS